MRVLTLSGWLDTEWEGQTLKGVGRLDCRIERQICEREMGGGTKKRTNSTTFERTD